VRLRRLEIRRLPGIDGPFAVEGLDPGLNVVVGPNASGKSSLLRAVRACLWPEPGRAGDALVLAEWDAYEGGEPWRCESDGQVARWRRGGREDPGPALPEPHRARCYTLGLRDLLEVQEAGGRGLAEQVRIQMSGGHDLRGLARELFESGPRFGRPEERALREASRERVRREGEQRQLAHEERELAPLRERERALREEAAEEPRLVDALRLAELRVELARARDELGALPEALGRLQGGELETLRDLDRLLERAQQERERALRERDGAAARERAARPEAAEPGAFPPDEEGLATARARLRALERLEERVAGYEREAGEAAGAVREALRQLRGTHADAEGDESAEAARLDGPSLDAVEQWWERAVALRERRRELERRRDARAAEARGADAAGLEGRRRAAEALRAWLAAPVPRRAWDPPALVGWVLLAGLGGAAAALSAPAPWPAWVPFPRPEVGPWPAWLPLAGGAAAGAGVLGAAVTALWRPGRAERRRLSQRAHELDPEAPPPRERAAALARLEVLDQRLREDERAREAAVAAEEIRRELEALAEEEAKQREIRLGLVSRLGVDPDPGDLRLVELARRVRAVREARRKEASAREALERARGERSGALEALAVALAAALGRRPADPAEAGALLDELERRAHEVRAAVDARRRAEDELERAGARARELAGRRRSLLEGAGVDAADPALARRRLEELWEELPAWRERDAERRRLEAVIGDLEAKLAPWPELQTAPAGELDARLRAAREAEAERERVREQVARIEGRVAAAAEGDALERALADEHEARARLEDRLEEALERDAGRVLLEHVEREFEQRSRPAVLERARAWFARFTHHRFELRVDDAGEGVEARFRARDTASGADRPLEELSDGTRMQLWMAARLAFATAEEDGAPLPLFLDEALTASDPERFGAVSDALLELASSGRQVFYLTCDPADAVRWRRACGEAGAPAPHEIDLASVRGRAAAADDDALLGATEPPAVPAWDGHESPEDYGRRLGVPRAVPFAPVEALHLFHVLRDRLDLLQGLLAGPRVETVGQWRTLRRQGDAAAWLRPHEVEAVDARADLGEAVVDLWQEGRGRPVDRAALRETGVVTDRYLEELALLADELEGDAERLCEAVEAGRVKYFRKKDELRARLEEMGHLDPREPLGPVAVQARVSARLREHLEAGRLDGAALSRAVEALLSALG